MGRIRVQGGAGKMKYFTVNATVQTSNVLVTLSGYRPSLYTEDIVFIIIFTENVNCHSDLNLSWAHVRWYVS